MPITGSSPNKSYTRSDGTRTGSAVCVQERDVAGLNNTAELADARENDLATAINAMLMKDGGNAATANIPMGGYKLTGLAAGSSNGDSVRYEQMNSAISAAISGLLETGTKAVFCQATAPTGWTKSTSENNAALRVVSGTSGGTYYSSGQAFTSATASGTVNGHSITQAELPNVNFTVTDPGHTHNEQLYAGSGHEGNGRFSTSYTSYTNSTGTVGSSTTGITVSSGGSGTAHTHTFTGSALDINYVDVIVCTRD